MAGVCGKRRPPHQDRAHLTVHPACRSKRPGPPEGDQVGLEERPASLSVVLVRVADVAGLWTPDGERRSEPTEEEAELAAQLGAMQAELADTPAAVVVTNHVVGLFQLAAIHLNHQPPNLEDGRLAIDAMAALVDGLSGRLGEEEPALREALAQLRLAFVTLSGGTAEA